MIGLPRLVILESDKPIMLQNIQTIYYYLKHYI